MLTQFQVSITCESGGARHTHTLHISCGEDGYPYGAGPPPRSQLEYSCPKTGKAHTAIFRPPVGAAKPFSVSRVE
jgi:hypothetical protein